MHPDAHPDIDQQDLRERAREVLLNNYHATGDRYITPAWPHYKNQWVWDSSFHAIACGELGMGELAKNEIRTLLEFQDGRGWIPHRIYHGQYNLLDLERPLYRTGGWHPETSQLVGQPVIAQAVEAINEPAFTAEVIEQLVAFYRYFLRYRDAENILSIISPRESGRDAAPEFDFFRPVMPKTFRAMGKLLDPLYVLRLDWRLMRAGWDEVEIFRRNIFHVKDVAEHCIFIDGLYALGKLLEQTDRTGLFPDIEAVTLRCERALLEQAWDDVSRTFYPLRVENTKEGQWRLDPIRELSLGALFPLLLRDLPADMTEQLVTDVSDPKSFHVPYPVPSVPACHPRFDPSGKFPIWRGPTWINSNWFLIRGLMRQGRTETARHIARVSLDMVSREGFREFFDPFDGSGMRVDDFGWSTLVTTFPRLVDDPPSE
jgi:hypothetical protein